MKRTRIKSRDMVAGVAALVIAAMPVMGAAQEKVALKFADWLPTTHDTSVQGANVFIEKAHELAGDSLEITFFPAEQLGKAGDSLRLAQTGVADIVNIAPAYITEKFPLSGVAELPNIYQDACDGSLAFMEMAQPGNILGEQEFARNDVRVLFVAGLGSYRVLTASKAVDAATGFEGLKLRTAGGAMDMAADVIGATSVRMPGPDVLPSLSRGTLDGVFWPLQSVRPWGLQDSLAYMTPDLGVGSFTMIFAISEKTWQKLPEEIQNALLEAGRFATEHHCNYTETAENDIAASLEAEDGIKSVPLPEADLNALVEKLNTVQETWAKALDERGLPGSDVLAAFRAALPG